jgi:lysophospholipid acyltransferase (LPLAT)-like uncharacterized protein
MRIRKIWHSIMLSLGPGVAFFLIKFLQWTMRIEELNGERIRAIWARGENIIGAFWHGRLLMTPLVYGGPGLKILISRHRDGELITRTVRHFGLETVRGSSTRGGIAGMKGLARALQQGYDVVIAPDGPRGPRFKVQPGIIQLARITGFPIFPLTFSAFPRKVLRSWDRFIIPYPFSRGVFVWGEPISIDRSATEQEIQTKTLLLEKRLQEITEKADRYCEKKQ